VSNGAIKAKVLESIGRVSFQGKILGTAFVISETEVATAAHLFVGKTFEDIDITGIQILVEFPSISVEFATDAAAFDWYHDVAVLRRVPQMSLTKLPAPIQIGINHSALSASENVRWLSHGYPPRINKSGFTVRGSIASHNAYAPTNNAPVLQLEVDQFGLKSMQGMSGAPIMVHDICIAVLREYPENVDEKTIYASPIHLASHVKGIGRALDQSKWKLPQDLEMVCQKQLVWVKNLRPMKIVRAGASGTEIYLPPTLRAANGNDVTGLAKMLANITSRGVVIVGEAGEGKTALLGEIVRSLVMNAGDLGESARTTPLLLSANDIVETKDFYESLFRQGRSLGLESASDLAALISKNPHPWLFLVDGLNEAVSSEKNGERLSNFLQNLDDKCKSGGHRWIATNRPVELDGLKLPDDTTILSIVPWKAEDTFRFLKESYGDIGEQFYRRLRLMPHELVLRNPLLLRAAAQLELSGKTELKSYAPTYVLGGFVEEVLADAARIFEKSGLSSSTRRALQVTGLQQLAKVSAVASLRAESCIDNACELLQKTCNLSYSDSRRVAEELISVPIARTGMLRLDEGGRGIWAHNIYRDYLAGLRLSEEFPEMTPKERKAMVEQALEPHYRGAVAMMLVELSKRKKGVNSQLRQLSTFEGIPTVVEFLAFGGELGANDIHQLVHGLCGLAHNEKHRGDSCGSLINEAFGGFSPLKALLSLAFLESARDCLSHLRSDVYIAERWKRDIDERLSTI